MDIFEPFTPSCLSSVENNNCTCFTVCAPVPEKEYATKAMLNEVYGDLLVEGVNFKYTCVENYNFVGIWNTKCQADGTWSIAGNCFLSKITTCV